jgi:Reverse transcriptase (RNA-dependent DNA polymerase)
MAVVDLEQAFDPVPREVIGWALRRFGVEEWLLTVIRAVYEGLTAAVNMKDVDSDSFKEKAGVHEGSMLSPLLCISVMEAFSREFRVGLP